MKLLIEGKEYEYCPQHGYSLPCDKCGLGQYELGKQAGIKEVVDWILKEKIVLYQVTDIEKGEISSLNPSILQAKLKEWGI
jgi:hypothetical protein